MTDTKSIFNANQDPIEELRKAAMRARSEKKNILVEMGADWCIWCHRLEQFIATHYELAMLRSRNFVHVRIFTGDGKTNPEILQEFPSFDGIPHYFVFSPEGKLLISQDTEPFEVGESYDYEKIWEFLATWGVETSHH
jgi:thiol:disulfide interchange protein